MKTSVNKLQHDFFLILFYIITLSFILLERYNEEYPDVKKKMSEYQTHRKKLLVEAEEKCNAGVKQNSWLSKFMTTNGTAHAQLL